MTVRGPCLHRRRPPELEGLLVARLFGTDGVRGLANGDVTAELALDLSVAAAHVLGETGAFAGHRPVAVVGRDPRASGEFLSAAVVAGLASAGVDVLRRRRAAHAGHRLPHRRPRRRPRRHALGLAQPDAGQRHQVLRPRRPQARRRDRGRHRGRGCGEPWQRPTGADVGRVRALRRRAARATSPTCSRSLPHRLDGLHVVVDCAHGAASAVAPAALRAAGAEVVVIGAEPDGLNINDGYGSTHLEPLQRGRRRARRRRSASPTTATPTAAWPSTRTGEVVDGDQIMAILALAMRERGALANDTLVATVMSNLGLLLAHGARGRHGACRPAVGDRYVLEEMRAGRLTLGGEQSGHVDLARPRHHRRRRR